MKLLRNLYLNERLFISLAIIAGIFVMGFFFSSFITIAKLMVMILIAVVLTDLILIYRTRKGIRVHRFTPERLSNGDDNNIRIYLENFYNFTINAEVIDEIPFQFQRRDLSFRFTLGAGKSHTIRYDLCPVKRGEYSFGSTLVFVSTPLGMLCRRFLFGDASIVPVYPSFLQMRHYELIAISNRLVEHGIKKLRRIGHNMEFELVREYIHGDDPRTINWKATARQARPMVNQYQDERSQQVFCVIDKGRVMQMPFNGMSLLDYAINASLVVANIAVKKYDKAGLITFQDDVGTFIPASGRNVQMRLFMEALYHEKTGYRESDFSRLFGLIRQKITQRSLLLLFTNFESQFGLQRQLPFLTKLAQRHLLVVVFFENTELTGAINRRATKTREVYYKAIAEKLSYDKKAMVRELNALGIQAIYTAPENLTVNTINKYLELKARGMI